MVFNQSLIKNIVFDLDGTLYDSEKEYVPGKGSVKTAQSFFRFLSFDRLSKFGEQPDKVAEFVAAEYKNVIKDNALEDAINKIPKKTRDRYLALQKKYRSHTKVFVEEFEVNSKFPHILFRFIDFESVLTEDKELQGTIQYLKNKGYELGILTAETFETLKKVVKTLGLNLEDFRMNTGDDYPVLCSNNVINKKPDQEGFARLPQIYNARPEQIVFVGDSFQNDIEPALKCDLQAVQVITSLKDEIYLEKNNIAGNIKQYYVTISNINVLRKLF